MESAQEVTVWALIFVAIFGIGALIMMVWDRFFSRKASNTSGSGQSPQKSFLEVHQASWGEVDELHKISRQVWRGALKGALPNSSVRLGVYSGDGEESLVVVSISPEGGFGIKYMVVNIHPDTLNPDKAILGSNPTGKGLWVGIADLILQGKVEGIPKAFGKAIRNIKNLQ